MSLKVALWKHHSVSYMALYTLFVPSEYSSLYRNCMRACKSLQSLCNPMDGSPPGSPVPGILQAGTLEWVAISFSNAWKWKGKVKSLSHVQLLSTPWTAAHQAPPSMGFSRPRVLEWGVIAFSEHHLGSPYIETHPLQLLQSSYQFNSNCLDTPLS